MDGALIRVLAMFKSFKTLGVHKVDDVLIMVKLSNGTEWVGPISEYAKLAPISELAKMAPLCYQHKGGIMEANREASGHPCDGCGAVVANKRCPCHAAVYCSEVCQRQA